MPTLLTAPSARRSGAMSTRGSLPSIRSPLGPGLARPPSAPERTAAIAERMSAKAWRANPETITVERGRPRQARISGPIHSKSRFLRRVGGRSRLAASDRPPRISPGALLSRIVGSDAMLVDPALALIFWLLRSSLLCRHVGARGTWLLDVLLRLSPLPRFTPAPAGPRRPKCGGAPDLAARLSFWASFAAASLLRLRFSPSLLRRCPSGWRPPCLAGLLARVDSVPSAARDVLGRASRPRCWAWSLRSWIGRCGGLPSLIANILSARRGRIAHRYALLFVIQRRASTWGLAATCLRLALFRRSAIRLGNFRSGPQAVIRPGALPHCFRRSGPGARQGRIGPVAPVPDLCVMARSVMASMRGLLHFRALRSDPRDSPRLSYAVRD